MSAEMSFPGGTIRAISLSYRHCRCGAGGTAGGGRVGATGDCLRVRDADERGREGGNRDAGGIKRYRDNVAHLVGGAITRSLHFFAVCGIVTR